MVGGATLGPSGATPLHPAIARLMPAAASMQALLRIDQLGLVRDRAWNLACVDWSAGIMQKSARPLDCDRQHRAD
jgi:hypothetical protein